MDEEALIAWQDVLDEILAGRTANLSCPYCNHTPLQVTQDERKTRVECQGCGKFIEGTFG